MRMDLESRKSPIFKNQREQKCPECHGWILVKDMKDHLEAHEAIKPLTGEALRAWHIILNAKAYLEFQIHRVNGPVRVEDFEDYESAIRILNRAGCQLRNL